MTEDWVLELTGSVWLYPTLFALTVGDAFLVVLPSEIAVSALAALWAATGSPHVLGVAVVAASAAIAGDSLCYAIGRQIGTDRWRWQRRPLIAKALSRAEVGFTKRAALLIFTARYVPYARIAVNLTAGSTRFSYRRFLPLSIAAGATWAAYHCVVGASFGTWFRGHPVFAVIVTVVGAMVVGYLTDLVSSRVARQRGLKNF